MSAHSRDSRSSSSSGSDEEDGHPMDLAVRRRGAASTAAASTAAATPPRCSQSPQKSPSPPESGEVPASKSASRGDMNLHAAQQPAAGSSRRQVQRSGSTRQGARSIVAALAGESDSLSDIDAALASGHEDTGSSDDESVDVEPAIPPQAPPTGVILVESIEERNAEVQRLLRAPRYFDEDYEEAGLRCFKCGGQGHFARDCSAEAKERSCFLCAQFGHDSRDCPNSLCWRCQRPGHMARDCPYGYRQQATWEEGSAAVCLRCGSESCSCAGQKDFIRADGGCVREYSQRDLERVRCYACGRRGHLSCAAAPVQAAKLTCFNCGQGGHSAGECNRDLPQVMRGEQLSARPAAQPYTERGGGGYSSSGRGYQQQSGGYQQRSGGYQQQSRGGGYGSQQDRFVTYTAHAEVEQLTYNHQHAAGSNRRQHSYDDIDSGSYYEEYTITGSGGGHGSGGYKRPRR